jgi:hypothetical protein
MSPDVHDLRAMLEARAEQAPDTAGMLADVRAGDVRRRRRRRVTAVAGTAAAAAAVAITSSLLLPAVRDTGSGPPAGGVRATDTTLSTDTELSIGLKANPTYRVTDVRLEPGIVELTVWPDYAEDIDATAADSMDNPLYRKAILRLVAPSRFDPAKLKENGERVSVNGHEAWYIPKLAPGASPESTPGPSPGQVSTPFENAVGWQVRDGSWVLLEGGLLFPTDELLSMANLVQEVPRRPLSGPVALPYLPDGVRPWVVTVQSGEEKGYGNQRLYLAFSLPGSPPPSDDPAADVDLLQVAAYELPSEVTTDVAAWGKPTRVGDKEIWRLEGAEVPTVAGLPVVSGRPEQWAVVVVRTRGCILTIGVNDKRKLPVTELERVARETKVGNCAVPSTWQPVLTTSRVN